MRALDLFSGAGGSSWGARLAGAEIVAGIDACREAGIAFGENFPQAKVFSEYLEDLDPADIHASVGAIDLLLASPECTNHSPAKGKGERSEASKETAFQVVRFASEFRPRWIVVENVPSMRNWTRYREFLGDLSQLGYSIRAHVLNAQDHGVPQSRRRLFLLCDRSGTPTKLPKPHRKSRTASQVIDSKDSFDFSRLHSERRAKATLERAERAIRQVGNAPFLLVYYGSDKGGGWQRLDRPLRTITTLDRFAYVKNIDGERFMRMLQVPELKRAMGMPQCFSVGATTRRASIRLIGNAVCPPVMRDVVRHLLDTPHGARHGRTLQRQWNRDLRSSRDMVLP